MSLARENLKMTARIVYASLIIIIVAVIEAIVLGHRPDFGSCPTNILLGVIQFNSASTFQLAILLLIVTPYVLVWDVTVEYFTRAQWRHFSMALAVLVLLIAGAFLF